MIIMSNKLPIKKSSEDSKLVKVNINDLNKQLDFYNETLYNLELLNSRYFNLQKSFNNLKIEKNNLKKENFQLKSINNNLIKENKNYKNLMNTKVYRCASFLRVLIDKIKSI